MVTGKQWTVRFLRQDLGAGSLTVQRKQVHFGRVHQDIGVWQGFVSSHAHSQAAASSGSGTVSFTWRPDDRLTQMGATVRHGSMTFTGTSGLDTVDHSADRSLPGQQNRS